MKQLTKKTWLKIILWAIVVHIILIVISVGEVFVYSLLNPGLAREAYSEHATLSGPYISMIFGFILFFLITRSLCKNLSNGRFVIALAFPIVYTIMDFLLVHFSGVNWEEHITVFLLSFGVKTLGALLGAFVGYGK